MKLLGLCLLAAKFLLCDGYSLPQTFINHVTVPQEYETIKGFFKHSDESIASVHQANFGLKEGISWQDVVDKLNELNSENHHHKLLFLARHGEGYHNIAPDLYNSSQWTCDLQTKNGDGEIEWFDAELTERGKEQIHNVSSIWQEQLEQNAPFPQSFYVSPLRRTLQTFYHTWSNLTNNAPIVKELARETYGIGTESKRHSKSYIEENFNFVAFEDNFKEEDDLWEDSVHESHQHRNYRAYLLLNDIFINDPNDIISITAHRGIIRSILKIVNHRKCNLGTGEVIPVIVKACKYGPFKKPNLTKKWKVLPPMCKDDINED